MQQPMSAGAGQLTEFDRDFSREGLWVRYARGRVRHFAGRQVMTLVGGYVLFAIDGPMVGLLAVLVALFGEAVDCLYLRAALRRQATGAGLARIYAISAATAGFQAATIGFCVGLSWFGEVSRFSPLFAIAFLAGAAINGGLVMPFHRGAAVARLAVYALSAAALFLGDLLIRAAPLPGFTMNAIGTLMLGLMVYAFLKHVNEGFRRNRTNTLALIEQSRALEAANRELVLRQKEAQQLSLVARNANDSVFLTDPEGRITWVNEAFTRITGYGAQEAIGRMPGDLLNGPATDAGTLAGLAEAIREGRPFRGELENVTRDGRAIWMETNQVPILDAEGRVEMMVAIERDITAAKRHAAEMAKARHAAEEGARAKAEFLATMSHEIRTPMNGVIGMADLICETRLSQEQRLYAETIRSSALALLTIINDILDLSKLDAGKMALNPVDFDLVACIEDSVQLLRPQARDKGLALTLDLETAIPERVRADDRRLRQVLINLIGNAIKFTETGSVSVRVRVQPKAERLLLGVEVADTGIGIPEDRLAHVFERFSQAEASTARRFGGTGLGLTISRMLVEEMGGAMSVTSTPGAGSCFGFVIDMDPAAAPPAVTRMPERDRAAHLCALTGKRILVAEDNKVNRLLITKFLRNIPVDLDFAHDGQQAVAMTDSHRPDLIFMDMSMPVIDGIEATRRIRARHGDRPVILALTANAFESDRTACLAAGMDGFLTKPVRRADLIEAMTRHFADLAAQSTG